VHAGNGRDLGANGISIPFPQTDMHLHLPDSDTAARPAMISALSGTSAADKDSAGPPVSAT
jgi:small-conductance mechanosensitive channel